MNEVEIEQKIMLFFLLSLNLTINAF